MRYLAIARFRLLTTIREATGVFVAAAAWPVLLLFIVESTAEPLFRAAADQRLGSNAAAALMAWIAHGIVMILAAIVSGIVKLPHDGPMIVVRSDLMDTAPVGPPSRFWGEALGTFGAMAVIHACCLPILAAVAALSPLPTSMFVWLEVGILVLMFLGSAGAAWQRRAPRTRYSFTRGARNAMVIVTLLLLIVPLTARWREFRDSLWGFVNHPSVRAWTEVTWTVENPLLMLFLVSLVYGGTILYYYSTSVWNRRQS